MGKRDTILPLGLGWEAVPERALEVFMQRVVHKSTSFKEAEDWDVYQNSQMAWNDRLKMSEILKKRAFGENCKDVREIRKCLLKKR